jgi:hypothetical protein
MAFAYLYILMFFVLMVAAPDRRQALFAALKHKG